MPKFKSLTKKFKTKKKKMSKANRLKTFTKKKVDLILGIALLDLQLSYLLAFLGREEIAESLSIAVVTQVIGVMLGYFAKSFFETKEEKINETRIYENSMSESSFLEGGMKDNE